MGEGGGNMGAGSRGIVRDEGESEDEVKGPVVRRLGETAGVSVDEVDGGPEGGLGKDREY